MQNQRAREFARLARVAAMAGLAAAIVAATAQAGADPHQTAAAIDASLLGEQYGADKAKTIAPAALADDVTFLRRVSLDLVGALPTPEQITSFVFDKSPHKRDAAVERLLSEKQFGQNWARYWRDTILYRRKDDRALLVAPALSVWLTEQFNKNVHWDHIGRALITATGDVHDEGSTAIIMAQSADPNDVTAEVSRLLLGIQIQCAQCHDHKTDRWKREQFHQLAAFFPRIGIRPNNEKDQRSFAVVSLQREKVKRAPGSDEEITLEHYMPDLNDPHAKGKLMQPILFATGQQLEPGLGDLERREKLAQWVTTGSDHWFSKAFVNRVWGELVGHGFCEPVDDMGPDREATAPHTFELLAAEFRASHYDIKWLFRTITATAAYQRASRSRHESDGAPFAASCPQRLRADQVFNALCDALGIDEATLEGPNKQQDRKRGMGSGPRLNVNRTFGYDPSTRRDEIGGSIPQALWMMNSGPVNRGVNGRNPASALGTLLATSRDDRRVVVELYLRCLAREPKPQEIHTCLEYVHHAKDRVTGFEDLLWALVNSTEFLHRN